jgi:hypothetical protein
MKKVMAVALMVLTGAALAFATGYPIVPVDRLPNVFHGLWTDPSCMDLQRYGWRVGRKRQQAFKLESKSKCISDLRIGDG